MEQNSKKNTISIFILLGLISLLIGLFMNFYVDRILSKNIIKEPNLRITRLFLVDDIKGVINNA